MVGDGGRDHRIGLDAVKRLKSERGFLGPAGAEFPFLRRDGAGLDFEVHLLGFVVDFRVVVVAGHGGERRTEVGSGGNDSARVVVDGADGRTTRTDDVAVSVVTNGGTRSADAHAAGDNRNVCQCDGDFTTGVANTKAFLRDPVRGVEMTVGVSGESVPNGRAAGAIAFGLSGDVVGEEDQAGRTVERLNRHEVLGDEVLGDEGDHRISELVPVADLNGSGGFVHPVHRRRHVAIVLKHGGCNAALEGIGDVFDHLLPSLGFADVLVLLQAHGGFGKPVTSGEVLGEFAHLECGGVHWWWCSWLVGGPE